MDHQQTTDFSSDDQAQGLKAESTIGTRLRLATEARRRRIRQRGLTCAIIFVPVLVAAFYLLALATPRYVAESRFSVQAAQSTAASPGGSSGTANILSAGAGSNGEAGFVGGWLVQDFLNSRDCMLQLDRKIGLRRYLVRSTWDPLTRLGPQANEDELFRAYQRLVGSSFNMIEVVNVLTVAAYSPADSQAVSNALLAVTQDFVNKMNQQGVNDAIRVSRQNVDKAEQQDREALRALARWRDRHGNFDPAANASMMLGQIGLVETDLSSGKLTVEKIKALENPGHPMLSSAQLQVQALERRESELRGLMVASAADLKTYSELTNAQTFADSNVMTARQGYQQALTNALALQRYIAVIARPVPEVGASQPNPYIFMLSAFAFGLVLAGATALATAIYRSFRHA